MLLLTLLIALANVLPIFTLISDEGYIKSRTGVSYKLYNRKETWGVAKRLCERDERAQLATPRNAKELEGLIDSFPQLISESAFIGFHSLFTDWDYHSVEGLSTLFYYPKWRKGSPNNAKNQCVELNENGMSDVNCNTKKNFICEKGGKNLTESIKPTCKTDSRGYQYRLASGKCFKLHTEPKPWGEAKRICEAENGNLVVVSNKNEEDYLVNMLNDPKNEAKNAKLSHVAHVGMHDIFQQGERVTVLNERQSKMKYCNWNNDTPYPNQLNGKCVAMFNNGGLIPIRCDETARFICEVKP